MQELARKERTDKRREDEMCRAMAYIYIVVRVHIVRGACDAMSVGG